MNWTAWAPISGESAVRTLSRVKAARCAGGSAFDGSTLWLLDDQPRIGTEGQRLVGTLLKSTSRGGWGGRHPHELTISPVYPAPGAVSEVNS